jgi:hypothetical protein
MIEINIENITISGDMFLCNINGRFQGQTTQQLTLIEENFIVPVSYNGRAILGFNEPFVNRSSPYT